MKSLCWGVLGRPLHGDTPQVGGRKRGSSKRPRCSGCCRSPAGFPDCGPVRAKGRGQGRPHPPGWTAPSPPWATPQRWPPPERLPKRLKNAQVRAPVGPCRGAGPQPSTPSLFPSRPSRDFPIGPAPVRPKWTGPVAHHPRRVEGTVPPVGTPQGFGMPRRQHLQPPPCPERCSSRPSSGGPPCAGQGGRPRGTPPSPPDSQAPPSGRRHPRRTAKQAFFRPPGEAGPAARPF
ncbi:basic proline-rich protein-like [Penaeus monodon]|uniref:basic proline-rich protein-like n=1 Tax=Penaeus monodon TaxID=6687 RepID=UPI0018A7BB90|nr:basic proline-rich protein-like [Penaeus monodon]